MMQVGQEIPVLYACVVCMHVCVIGPEMPVMYVCMYYVCMCVWLAKKSLKAKAIPCIYACLCACVHMRMHVYVYVHMRNIIPTVHIHTRTHLRIRRQFEHYFRRISFSLMYTFPFPVPPSPDYVQAMWSREQNGASEAVDELWLTSKSSKSWLSCMRVCIWIYVHARVYLPPDTVHGSRLFRKPNKSRLSCRQVHVYVCAGEYMA
jgi:hypothetical protein